MEFVAAGWCTGKYLRLDQTITLLGMIGPEVTRFEKDRIRLPPGLAWGGKGPL